MKKLFLLTLLMGGLCASAVTPISPIVKKNLPLSKVTTISRTNGLVPQAVAVQNDGRAKVTPNEDGALVWDFEDAAQFAEFTLVDNDGDGYNWQYYNNTGLETGLMTTHEGMGVISSASYVNDGNGGGAAVTPDNWLISPVVDLGGSLSFWALGQDADWCDEVFGVYVCIGESTNPADFVQVGADKTATGEYVLCEYDLTPYAGQTGRFAIVHHNVTDMFMLNIDDITLDVNHVVLPEPTLPTDLTVEPAATYADVAWVPGENNDTWNLRYRPYVDPALLSRLWDLPNPGYEDQLEGIMIWDADGDGNNWGLAANDDAQTDLCFVSSSYANGTALSPDNWLIFPEMAGGGTFKFKTWNYLSNWPDVIGVFVTTNPDFESADEFVQLGEDITPGSTPEEHEFDLSEYAGQNVVIAIRHYNCTDQFRIYVDDVEYALPDAPEVQEWIEVEDVASPFTIDELTPETTYEVQVKAFGPADVETFNAAGGKATEWTESTIFTTLAEDPLVGVETVKVETTGDNNYYNLMGQKVTGNLPAGIYIHNGKKIVVR